MTSWILSFFIYLIFSLWIVIWGGAERLEGTFSSGFIINIFAPRWSAEGIKLFVRLSLFVNSIWFIIGLFEPSARFF
jgi:hypothetical protein